MHKKLNKKHNKIKQNEQRYNIMFVHVFFVFEIWIKMEMDKLAFFLWFNLIVYNKH